MYDIIARIKELFGGSLNEAIGFVGPRMIKKIIRGPKFASIRKPHFYIGAVPHRMPESPLHKPIKQVVTAPGRDMRRIHAGTLKAATERMMMLARDREIDRIAHKRSSSKPFNPGSPGYDRLAGRVVKKEGRLQPVFALGSVDTPHGHKAMMGSKKKPLHDDYVNDLLETEPGSERGLTLKKEYLSNKRKDDHFTPSDRFVGGVYRNKVEDVGSVSIGYGRKNVPTQMAFSYRELLKKFAKPEDLAHRSKVASHIKGLRRHFGNIDPVMKNAMVRARYVGSQDPTSKPKPDRRALLKKVSDAMARQGQFSYEDKFKKAAQMMKLKDVADLFNSNEKKKKESQG